MGQGKSKQNPVIAYYAGAILAAAGLVVLIFLLASKIARIPPLPRAALDPDEVEEAMSQMHARLRGFSFTVQEREIHERLISLHIAETGDQAAPVTQARVEAGIQELTRLMTEAAGTDQARFLLLGDALAFEFDRALEKVLALARQSGLKQVLLAGGPEVNDLKHTGGAFVLRAIEKGLISETGDLRVHRIVPIAMFKMRWRHLANLPMNLGLSEVERRAYWDYVITFVDAESVPRRLSAIEELKKLEHGYDDVIARSIIHHEAGDDSKAYELLKAAVEGGRNDRSIKAFLRALEK